jgi:hypothetical protein
MIFGFFLGAMAVLRKYAFRCSRQIFIEHVNSAKVCSADKPGAAIGQIERPPAFVENETHFNSLLFQESEAIIILKIIFRVQAINGHRIIIPPHFPHDGCYVVDIIEFSNKK